MFSIINIAELVLFIIALYLTNAKVTISFLILLNVWKQFFMMYSFSQIGSPSSEYRYDEIVTIMYFVDGAIMMLFALTALFLVTKVSYFIALIILSHSMLQLSMAVVTYCYSSYDIDIYWVFDVHSRIEPNFVILYLISAWMCIYLSRKAKHG